MLKRGFALITDESGNSIYSIKNVKENDISDEILCTNTPGEAVVDLLAYNEIILGPQNENDIIISSPKNVVLYKATFYFKLNVFYIPLI